jgi:hypothetical protein
MRRRKIVYPPAKTATKGGAANTDPRADARAAAANRVVSIDLSAIHGRSGLVPGTRVEVTGGVHAGETGLVESIAGGVIPAVVIRMESGVTRRVRTVDVTPLARPSEELAGRSDDPDRASE